MRRRLILTSAALAPVAAAGCQVFQAEGQARPRPNVVYVLTDQWRAQATGYAGDRNVKRLDTLTSQSIEAPRL